MDNDACRAFHLSLDWLRNDGPSWAEIECFRDSPDFDAARALVTLAERSSRIKFGLKREDFVCPVSLGT